MKSEAEQASELLIGDLRGENDRLKAENAQLRASAGLRSPDFEKLVSERIRASGGQLERKHAIEAVEQQLAWDKDPANASRPNQSEG